MPEQYTPHALIGYRNPYDWDWMMGFLARRAVAGLEAVCDGGYRRTLALNSLAGWVCVTPEINHSRVAITVSDSLQPVLMDVQNTVRRMFDLDADPQAINATLGPLAHDRPGLRLPGAAGGFEFAVRAILEQQISTAAAARLIARFVARFGTPISTNMPGLTHLFPTAEMMAHQTPEALREAGMTAQRARAVQQLAEGVARGAIEIEAPANIETARLALQALPGIGPWTAGYIALRGWSAKDVFLESDHAIGQHFAGQRPAAIARAAQCWKPFRSYAVLHLWGQ